MIDSHFLFIEELDTAIVVSKACYVLAWPHAKSGSQPKNSLSHGRDIDMDCDMGFKWDAVENRL